MVQKSGQVILRSASVTQLPDITCSSVLFVGHPNNSQEVFVGNAGDWISVYSGFPLNPGAPAIRVRIDGNLNEYYGIATVDADVLCWLVSTD